MRQSVAFERKVRKALREADADLALHQAFAAGVLERLIEKLISIGHDTAAKVLRKEYRRLTRAYRKTY